MATREEIDALADDLSIDLRYSAHTYYKIGIDVFHKTKGDDWVDFQPAIGNLSIAVEILLKAIVAKKAVNMLFTNVPTEVSLLLTYPESLVESNNLRGLFSEVRKFSYKIIELNNAIGLFNLFFPNLKNEYKQFFTALKPIRNASVHSSVPEFKKYEVERIAYWATKLFMQIHEFQILKHSHFFLDGQTENFLKHYEESLVKKVKKTLENAREKVKNGKIDEANYGPEDWASMHATCPICNNTATVYGDTEDHDTPDGVKLTFLCECFMCGACGLELYGFEELELAGIETSIDRSDDTDEWHRDYDYESIYERY